MKRARNTPRNSKLIVILMVSILLRVVAAQNLGDQVDILPGTYDQLSYHTLALRLLDGHGFTFGQPWWPLTAAAAPTAHWSYLYTFYLALIYTLFGPHPLVARLIQAVLIGLFQPLLAYLIGRRVFGEAVGLVAAILTAVYAYFIYYAATLMTESFYITAILGAIYLSIRLVHRAVEFTKSKTLTLALGLGLTLGIAVLLRQIFLLFIPFLFLWLWWASRRKSGRSPIQALAISSLIIIPLILPFTLYNYLRFNRFVLLNTNAGYAFFWANHPVYGTRFEPILPPERGTYQSLIPAELRHLDEASLDQQLLKRGLQFVLDDPVRYLRLSLSRIPGYFMFWPSSESSMISNFSRVGSFGLLWPFMLYGLLITLFSRPPTFQPPNASDRRGLLIEGFNFSSPAFLLILFSGVYTAIHLLSWALIRYRLPVDAVMLVFASLAIVDLVQRFQALPQASRHAS